MDTKKIFDTIDELSSSYVDVWEDVCNIESPTACKAGVDAVGNYFINIARVRGWKIEVLESARAGNAVCITMNPEATAAPISLSGHMDTVHPVGAFGAPAVRRDGEKIYGPGVADCKGGIVAGFLAMDALHKCNFTARPVRMLLQSDEETGSSTSKKATIKYICEKAKDSIAFLNLEGHSKGEACIERKGIITFTFTVNGIEAHSSNCAEKGANAIAEAAHKIIELEKIKDADGLTCCCSIISGGTTSNTVPSQCIFKANVRYATKEQQAYIRAKMQQVADTVYIEGCHTTVTQPAGRVSMELEERNVALLAVMNDIFDANGLPRLKASRRKGGSDAADVTVYGIPCVDSLGVRGGEYHTRLEYAYIDSLAESAKRLAAVIYSI